MDPFAIATIVATLMATKAVERVGETIGERGIIESTKLLDLLGRKSPEIVKRLAATNPDEIDYEIVEQVRLATADPEIQLVVEAIALLYRSSIGSYESEELLYIKSIAINREQLGDQHPDTAISLNNLAVLYKSMGRYEAAELLYLESMKIWKEQLGDRHPDTATGLNKLAVLYYNTHQYQKALAFIQEALPIYIQTLGSTHPATQNANGWLQAIWQAIANQ